MTDFKDIINLIRKEQVTLFLGAGFSYKAGAPSAWQLKSAILDSMTSEEKEQNGGRDLDDVAEEYELIYGRDRLLSIIEGLMSFERKDLSDHEYLKFLPHVRHIITTNYDTLIEDTLGEECFVVRTVDDCAQIPNDKVIVFKIHGDFLAPENIVITKSDYTKLLKEEKNRGLWNYVKTEFLTKHLLFIGYSLDDANIYEIVKEVRKDITKESRSIHLIAPGMQEHRVNRLFSANVNYYDAKAEHLFPTLLKQIKKNITKDYKKKHVSYETYCRFLKEYDLSPVVESGDKVNRVLKWNSQLPQNYSIHFSTIDARVKALADPNGEVIYDSYFPNSRIPAIELDVETLSELDITINGLEMFDKEDMAKLYIGPTQQEKMVTVRFPSKEFSLRGKVVSFQINPKSICFLYENPVYCLRVECTEAENGGIHTTFTSDFNANFKCGTEEARKYIRFLYYLWSGEKFIITGLPIGEMHVPVNDNDGLKNITDFKDYLDNLHNIEYAYNVEFSCINTLSKRGLELSKVLVAAKNKTCYNERIIEKAIEIIDYELRDWNNLEEIEVGNAYQFTMSRPLDEKAELNGISFPQINEHTIMTNASVTSLRKKKDRMVDISLAVNTDQVLKFYSIGDIKNMDDFMGAYANQKRHSRLL